MTENARAEMDRFLLLAIHDLRTPIRESFLYSQLLERSTAGTLGEESTVHLRGLAQANLLANTFVTRLAEYCQAGLGAPRVPYVSADVLLRNAIQTHWVNPEGLIVEDVTDCLVPVALQKVFSELLDNARKFRRGALSVRISSRRTESECTFEVRDNGIGFESQYADRIWEPLQRLHGRGEYPGFGLGLAISRRIVEGLNGRIWATSTVGEGSSFCIAVPLE